MDSTVNLAGAEQVAIHEIGHAGFGLADEYCEAGGDRGARRASLQPAAHVRELVAMELIDELEPTKRGL
ncbi:MAG: hypothetical protein QM674_19835 [Burkholderiaceae bacterium]